MTIKYQTLQPFLEEILESIRRDIKTDYLPGSASFYRSHFGNRPIKSLTSEEINTVFIKELLAGNEDLSEWVVNRWVFKHGDVYSHFAKGLAKINTDFDAIKALSEKESRDVLAGAKEAFGAKSVYFFAMLNGVVFPESIFAELKKGAEDEQVRQKEEKQKGEEETTVAKMVERHEREMSRMIEKYEQKLAGVLKKYMTDVEGLKAQVRALQKK